MVHILLVLHQNKVQIYYNILYLYEVKKNVLCLHENIGYIVYLCENNENIMIIFMC